MGVQPPSDEISDEPDVIEFGIAALAARLEERSVSFPVGADRLRAEHGDLSVPVDAGGTEITLADALDGTSRRQFESEQDLLNALHPVFEQRRERSARSIIAQLRALVPF